MYNSRSLRLFALDQDCRKGLDKTYAGDPHYLPSEFVLPSSIQGFVLCRYDKAPVLGFYCFPFVRKRRWIKQIILRVVRPLSFSLTEDLTKDEYNQFFQEINELGRRTGAHLIEAELYREIRSRIFFPSTDCIVNTYNDPSWVNLFENAGFKTRQSDLCYQVDLNNFRKEDDPEIRVRILCLDSDKDKKAYYDLWTLGGGCPYAAFVSKGSIWEIDDRVCSQSKLIMEWMLWDTYDRLAKANKDPETDSLSNL